MEYIFGGVWLLREAVTQWVKASETAPTSHLVRIIAPRAKYGYIESQSLETELCPFFP